MKFDTELPGDPPVVKMSPSPRRPISVEKDSTMIRIYPVALEHACEMSRSLRPIVDDFSLG